MQDLSIVKSVSATKDNTVYETKTDKFSSVLSKAADDPSLLKVPVAKKEESKAKAQEKEVVTAKMEDSKPLVGAAAATAVVTQAAGTGDEKTEKKEEPEAKEVTSNT